MRPRNRKIKKNATFTAGSMSIASLILCLFVVAMTFWVYDARCTSIQDEIGSAEKELRTLESECERQRVRWNEMTTPERVDERLARFGLEMLDVPPTHLVHLTCDGRLVPNQTSVARLTRARMSANVASAKTSTPPLHLSATSRRRSASSSAKSRTSARP